MKVTIEFSNTDENQVETSTSVLAVMEKRPFDLRFVYVEDLAGDGRMTKSTILLSDNQFMLTRKGVINCEFIYGTAVTHHTVYETPYGKMPVTITTKDYSVVKNSAGEPFDIMIAIDYEMAFEGTKPMDLSLKAHIFATQE